MNKKYLSDNQTKIILYTGTDGDTNVGIFFKDKTVWLMQRGLAELFGVKVPTISKHLTKIYETGEMSKEATISILETVQQEGGREVCRKLELYNLDAIIAVGYRVNSYQATQFRIWATRVLREFMTKGFVLDNEQLKQGNRVFGRDYFEELLEQIREIRASERQFYQKIINIYALAADYNKNALMTKDFFAMVQNRFYWAITGKASTEIIYDSADATKIHMGLTKWK